MQNTREYPKPDTGYAWVMVLITVSSYIIVNGIAYSFGVLMVELVSYFEAPRNQVALISSIMMGCMYVPCAFTSAFVTTFGPRNVAFTGSFLATAGLGLSYFATSLAQLYVSLGVVLGLGLGILAFTPFVATQAWFRKRLGVATALTAGFGAFLGTIFMAPVTQFFITLYGWRGTMLMLCGIVGQCAVLSLLLRPAPEFEPADVYEDVGNLEADTKDLALQASDERNVKNFKTDETFSLIAGLKSNDEKPASIRKVLITLLRESIDFSILRIHAVRIVLIADLLSTILFTVPFIFLPDKAVSLGISKTKAALLVSIVSASGASISFFLGWLSDKVPHYRHYCSGFFFTVIGVTAMCSQFMTTFPTLAVFAAIVGMHGVVLNTMQGLIIRDAVPPDQMTKAVGMWFVITGVDSIIAGPLVGGIYDLTGSYDLAFMILGGLILLAAALMVSMPHTDRCLPCTKRSEDDT